MVACARRLAVVLAAKRPLAVAAVTIRPRARTTAPIAHRVRIGENRGTARERERGTQREIETKRDTEGHTHNSAERYTLRHRDAEDKFLLSLLPGKCNTDANTNVTACVCTKGFHGIDCSLKGGQSSKGVAAAISGGIIAAIVIAGVVIALFVSFGAKKGYDWVSMRDANLAAAKNNPTFENPTHEAQNALYDDSGSTPSGGSPR